MNRLVLFLTVVLALVAPECKSKPEEVQATLGQEISLAPGQTVRITNEDLAIKFIAITEDSRCPEGATCIWAGQASASVELTKNNITSRKILGESGRSFDFSRLVVDQFVLNFRVNPYPKADKPVAKESYRLLLKVEKKVEGPDAKTFE
jgi:hypothetical protein